MPKTSSFTCAACLLASLLCAGTIGAQTPPAPPTPPPLPAAQPQPVPPSAPNPQVVVVQPAPAQPTPPQPSQPPVVVVQPPGALPPAPPPTVYVVEVPPPPGYAPAQQPTYVPPPPPPPQRHQAERGVRTHDGFYFRAGLGAGGLAAGIEDSDGANTTLSTGGAALELAMGGTLGEGFVLGGKLLGVVGNDLTLESHGDTSHMAGSLSLASLQLCADWYFDPKGGFHVQGGLGPTSLKLDPTDDNDDGDAVTLNGVGGSLGIGYEGWIGKQWSLGGLLQLQWAALEGSIDEGQSMPLVTEPPDSHRSVVAVAPMLMLTVTYH